MKKLIIVASVLALVAGCKTMEELRREEIARATERMRTDIEGFVRANQYEDACSYIIPKGSDDFVRSAIRRNYNELIDDLVFPAWAAYECKCLRDKVSILISVNKFGEARECIWCLPKTGKPRVDNRVAVERYKLLSGTVNMTELAYARKFMFEQKKKAIEVGTVAQIVSARKAIAAYPQVSIYTKKLDEKIQAFSDALEMVGVHADKIDYILTEVRQKIADSFIDERGTFKEKEGPDTTDSFSKWADLKLSLAKYGCSEQQIKEISDSFDLTIRMIVDAAVKEAKGPAVPVELGTSAMKERLERTRQECLRDLLGAGIIAAKNELVNEIKQMTANKKFIEARKRILEAKSLGDAQLDYSFYRVRIATLNTLVNPGHSDEIIFEMNAKCDELIKQGKFSDAYAYLTSAKGIDDSASYAQIIDALKSIRHEMKSLAITDAAVAGYIEFQVRETLRKLNEREFKDAVERDHTKLSEALGNALGEFAKMYGGEVYDTLAGKRFAAEIYNAVVSGDMPTVENRSYSTARANLVIDLNRSRLIKLVEVQNEKWMNERKNMDARNRTRKLQLDYDEKIDSVGEISSVAKAIELQLCDKPEGVDGMGPVLGEFMRIMRKWQSANEVGKMTDDEVRALLAAAIYLNEDEVVDLVLENISDSNYEILNIPVKVDPRKRTVLLTALQFRRWGAVKKLTKIAEVKVDGSVKDGLGNSIMHYLAEGYSWRELDRFKEYVSAETTTNTLGETALFNAARMDNAKTIEALVEMIVDEDTDKQLTRRREFVNAKNVRGETAMTIASAANACDAMTALAAAHADFGGRDLAAAAKGNCLAAVKWLVVRGVDVNWVGDDGIGVMNSVPTDSETEKYLVRQGGIRVIRETMDPKPVLQDSLKAQKPQEKTTAPSATDKKVAQ